MTNSSFKYIKCAKCGLYKRIENFSKSNTWCNDCFPRGEHLRKSNKFVLKYGLQEEATFYVNSHFKGADKLPAWVKRNLLVYHNCLVNKKTFNKCEKQIDMFIKFKLFGEPNYIEKENCILIQI